MILEKIFTDFWEIRSGFFSLCMSLTNFCGEWSGWEVQLGNRLDQRFLCLSTFGILQRPLHVKGLQLPTHLSKDNPRKGSVSERVYTLNKLC